MLKSFFVVLTVLASAGIASQAFADVTLYQGESRPRVIQQDLQLSPSSFKAGERLNKGTAAQEVLGFIARYRQVFGLREVNGEVLPLRAVHSGRTGFTLRFIQRHHRVHIDGAEVLAIFDRGGRLRSLNSSLIPTPTLSVQPSVSRDEALQRAVAAMRYQEPELGAGNRDGLLITFYKRTPVLVWQFSLREYQTGDRPAQIQVVANGSAAGRILKVVSASMDAGHGDISIYDASVTIVIPNPIFKGVKVLHNGRETLAGKVLVSDVARTAHTNLQKTRDYYSSMLKRVSYDGQGAEIVAAVNTHRIGFLDLMGVKQNAAWIGPWKMFAFGAGGEQAGGFEKALDVVAHEFTHAVIDSSSQLKYEGQSGALNEHLADVFGAIVQGVVENPAQPFLIGENILKIGGGKPIRDMLNPENGFDPQPGHVREMPDLSACTPSGSNDNCGVHLFSGIPNRAFAMSARALGWDTAAQLYFRVMTGRLRSSSQFVDYRNQVMAECAELLPQEKCEAVEDGFKAVGL